MLFYSNVDMDNIDETEVRLIKHPRWSPSPVDLTVATNLTTQSALIALGASSPSNYSLNNMLVSGSHLPNSILNSRKQREFIPESKKDESYWDRRKRNNEAAKRSREKRRISDMVLETRVVELTRENSVLRAELYAIKEKFGLSHSQHFIDPDTVSLSLPEGTHRGRRNKLLSTIISTNTKIDHNSNGSVSTYTSSSSPTSSTSSEPTLSPKISNFNHNHSPLNSKTLISVHSPTSTSCNNASSLPHKLRHKAKTATNDSDSGSDSCCITTTDCNLPTSVSNSNLNGNGNCTNGNCNDANNYNHNNNNNNNNINNNNINNNNNDSSVLRTENYTLRNELQRLASEVASLKNALVPTPVSYSMTSCNSSSNNNNSSNTNQVESRSSTPLQVNENHSDLNES